MLSELRILILTSTLISCGWTTTADIIVQPGYGKAHTQYPQTLIEPVQQQQQQLGASRFGPTQGHLVPIYANGRQGGMSSYRVGHPLLHYPHYPHYPQYPRYVHVLPRYAPQRHLRVLKLGGHKVFQPSWFVGQPAVPLPVHQRYKKSINEELDSGKLRKNDVGSTGSSLNPLKLNTEEIEDKHIVTRESKDDPNTSATLFNLNPELLNIYPEDNTKSSKLNEATESNSETSTKEPKLGNFPDPRPRPIKQKNLKKKTSMPKNSQDDTIKDADNETPIVGSPNMVEGTPRMTLLQHECPTTLPIYNYYQQPLYTNLFPPTTEYPPFYIIRYSTCNELPTQQGMEFPQYLPQNYNYVSNYVMGYPGMPSYMSNPIPYTSY